jgi:rare lipoprotein A
MDEKEKPFSAEVAGDSQGRPRVSVPPRPPRNLRAKALFAIVLAAVLAGCSHSRAPRSAAPAPSAAAPAIPAEQTGIAAWYGSFHAGQRTASGEVFDPDAMTASHRTLPLGSFVWVTNLANNRHVKVKINDRGPRDETRLIELSRAAAQALGFSPSDEMKVKVEPVARD